ncbi:MAG: GNAT family N-acetyltransferase [Clostridia bacterium]|nr:GNAT family N-acetyltransferase [Clostridia bacterium]
MKEIYKGRGCAADNGRLIEVLDDVFFRDEDPEVHFLSLLPKLYKDKYEPAYNNFMIKEDGDIKASVGLFPMTMNAGGIPIKIGGIGNVAVARDARGKGYMIECMNMTLDQMKNDGTDISLLGGQRQRYEHFGYEPAGISFCAEINRRTVSYLKGDGYTNNYTAKEITADDKDILRRIKALHEETGVYVNRPEEDYEDILRSWSCIPYAVFDGDEFKGYFCRRGESGIQEFKPVKTEDTLDLALCVLNTTGADKIEVSIPLYDKELCDYLSSNSDGYELTHSEQINILNYKKFILAFLSVKAKRVKLGDGSAVLLIHGYRKDEQLKITVRGTQVTVEDTDGKPDVELDHIEAIRVIASTYGGKRREMPACAAGWFPVDFFFFSQDNV